MDRELLDQFKDKRISIYNLHVPLDNFGEYSTSTCLARALGITIDSPFAPYFGGMSGVIGKTSLKTVKNLKQKFQDVVGHKVSLYPYGKDIIKDGGVALVAGGGNDVDTLKDLSKKGINVFVTGIAVKNSHSKEPHTYAQQNGINILGGTHYSTEMFACIARVDYFKKLGLPSEFIAGTPIMEDI